MNLEVAIRNRQRARRIDVARLRRIAESLLRDDLALPGGALGIHLVSARAMARLNGRWLRHAGSTDILTFDHRPPNDPHATLHGECFISLDDADRQAVLFRTTPAHELVRYVVHGVLHLQGYDDREPRERRTMKRVENRLVRRLASRFALTRLVRRPVRSPWKNAPPGSSCAPAS